MIQHRPGRLTGMTAEKSCCARSPSTPLVVAWTVDLSVSIDNTGSRQVPAIRRLIMPKAVSLIRSNSLSGTAEYAYAATAPADARLIFLAGSCPLDEDGSTVGVGDYAAQAGQCIENMNTALNEAGASVADVISTRVLVASTKQADLVTAWEVVRDAFGEHDVPTTLLGVTVLGYDDQLVEVEAIAAVRD